MSRSFHARHARTIMTLLVVSVPLVTWGVVETFQNANNHISQWLPEDFEETRVYEEFCELFGTDDFAMVSWDGCTLDDPRLAEFARAIVPEPELRRPGDGSECFAAVLTGAEAIATLTAEPFGLPRDEALRRLEGTLVGPDHESTCALVTYSDIGNQTRPATLKVLERIAVERCRIEPDQLHLGGSTIYNTAIDIESELAIKQWIMLSVLVALVVTWRCLRGVKLTAMVLITAVYGSALGTAAVHCTGGTMNLVLVVLPALIYVLTLSAGVHLSNYYRDAIRESGVAGAPQRALAHGWAPCVLSAVTTALGLASLYVSHILPVKMFGLYASIGVLLSLGVLFLLLPASMEVWPLRPSSKTGRTEGSIGRGQRLLQRMIDFIIRRRVPVAVACLMCLILLGSGVAQVKTSLRPLRFFDPNGRWIRDTAWFEKHLGSLVPIEVELVFDKGQLPSDDWTTPTFLDRMELVDRVAASLETLPYVGGTMSAATFGLPYREPESGSSRSNGRASSMGGLMAKIMGVRDREATQRSILNQRLIEHRETLIERGLLGHDDGHEIWRLSVRVTVLNDIEYAELLQAFSERVDVVLAHEKLPPGMVRPVHTGLIPLAQVGQRELINGLFKSYCLALVLIAVVMILLMRNVWAGLLAMLPNMFPSLVIFGIMGWAAMRVDIGAMMTASVALGIAVDDTLHFLTWFRRAVTDGKSRYGAIIVAYRRCAPAMTQTTLIAGLGMLVFTLSSFQPTAQFGLLMFVLLVGALVGDLVFLPAILATRLGRVFVQGGKD